VIERMIGSYPAPATIVSELAHRALTVADHHRGPQSSTNAAKLPEPLLRRVGRLLRIGWTMEGGLPTRTGGAVRA
jgi:hypothetical protein